MVAREGVQSSACDWDGEQDELRQGGRDWTGDGVLWRAAQVSREVTRSCITFRSVNISISSCHLRPLNGHGFGPRSPHECLTPSVLYLFYRD